MGGDKILQGTGEQKNEDRDDEAHKSEIACSGDVTGYWGVLCSVDVTGVFCVQRM